MNDLLVDTTAFSALQEPIELPCSSRDLKHADALMTYDRSDIYFSIQTLCALHVVCVCFPYQEVSHAVQRITLYLLCRALHDLSGTTMFSGP